MAVETYGIPLASDATPANLHGTPRASCRCLRQLAGHGLQGPAIGDLGYRGERLTTAAAALGVTVRPIARGRDGVFIPTEITRVVERSFGWLSRYRRLNAIIERTEEHLVAFGEIAFSVLSRGSKRLTPQAVGA